MNIEQFNDNGDVGVEEKNEIQYENRILLKKMLVIDMKKGDKKNSATEYATN